jgi:hypothetical protein
MRRIELTKGEFALVSDKDFARLNQWSWYCQSAGCGKKYAARRESRASGHKLVLMHNVVMGSRPGKVDHINRNGLDNRRRNLRLHNGQHENMRNQRARTGTSSFKGVSRRSDGKKWVATITVDGERIHIGSFESEREAAIAYDTHARSLHGRFSSTNRKLGLL